MNILKIKDKIMNILKLSNYLIKKMQILCSYIYSKLSEIIIEVLDSF